MDLYESEVKGYKRHGFRVKNAKLGRTEKLVAVKRIKQKNTEEGTDWLKMEVHTSSYPAHFHKILLIGKKKTITFDTGSGGADKYLDLLMPVLEEIISGMIRVEA